MAEESRENNAFLPHASGIFRPGRSSGPVLRKNNASATEENKAERGEVLSPATFRKA